ELRGRDGLDLPPKPVDRVAVDAREEAPVAPRLAPVEARPEHDSLAFEGEEERIVDAVRAREDGAERFEPAPQHRLRVARRLRRARAAASARPPPRRGELVEPGLPGTTLLEHQATHPEESLVHFLGRSRLRPCLVAHARDRLRIEDADLVRGLRSEDAARVD